MKLYTITLSNGIRCVLAQTRQTPVVHCGLTVGAGSRDELPEQQGIAHFIEHCIFKGTEKRRAFHINNRLDNLGGELNAYTTKEETVVYATTLRTDFPKAVELIADVVFHSVFPMHELDRERDVVAEEINSYKDSPSELIYDDFEDMLFKDSALGHHILGTKRTLNRFKTDDLQRFMQRTYCTDQMIFSLVGSVSEQHFERICRRFLEPQKANLREFSRSAVSAQPHFELVKNKSTYQTHCIWGAPAYHVTDERRIVLSLLVNILGGPSANSLLNTSLREKNGLTYNVEAAYTPYIDTGIFSIYFGTDKNQVDRCNELIFTEIDRLKKGQLTARQFSVAKKQFIGQLAISMESNEGYMLAIGKSMLIYNEIDSMDRIARRIQSITLDELTAVANDIVGAPLSCLIFR